MNTRIRAEFTDVDQFLEQIRLWGWNGSVRQTEPGQFTVALDFVRADGMTALRTRHGVGNLREVGTPPGMRTFGLVVPGSASNVWCNQRFDRSILQMMPSGDYVAANAHSHLGYQFAFTDELISEVLEQLEYGSSLDTSARRFELTQEQAARLVNMLDSVLDAGTSGDLGSLSDGVLSNFVGSFMPALARPRPSVESRIRAFERARDYIDANLSEPLTLSDICRAVGTSRRTLTQGFREQLDLSPMQYIKLLRLNLIRDALARGEPTRTRIVDVANGVGLWHMGQLAHDYRALFGEPPSDTLARR